MDMAGLVETVRPWWSSCQEILTNSVLGTSETMHNRSRYTLSERAVIKLLTGRATRKSPGGPLARKLPGSTCLQVTVDRWYRAAAVRNRNFELEQSHGDLLEVIYASSLPPSDLQPRHPIARDG